MLVTARHALFPPNDGSNVYYARTDPSAPRRDILLLSTKVFDNFLDSIKIRIRWHGIMAERHERQIAELCVRVAGEDMEDVERAMKQLGRARQSLDDAMEVTKALDKFYNESEK